MRMCLRPTILNYLYNGNPRQCADVLLSSGMSAYPRTVRRSGLLAFDLGHTATADQR
jgi:hypothetical protein